MSACHNIRLHCPLKTVFNKLGDTYQAYCNIYKTHTMATHHGGAGQSFHRDTVQHGQDSDIPNDYHHENMNNFENMEQENNTNLAILTRHSQCLCCDCSTIEGESELSTS